MQRFSVSFFKNAKLVRPVWTNSEKAECVNVALGLRSHVVFSGLLSLCTHKRDSLHCVVQMFRILVLYLRFPTDGVHRHVFICS